MGEEFGGGRSGARTWRKARAARKANRQEPAGVRSGNGAGCWAAEKPLVARLAEPVETRSAAPMAKRLAKPQVVSAMALTTPQPMEWDSSCAGSTRTVKCWPGLFRCWQP